MPSSVTADTGKRKSRGSYSSPRQEARQQHILRVAREEIAALGYDATTMQGLAEAAAVSKKTLYNLYGSKDELLLAAVENLLEEMRQRSSQIGARAGVESLMAVCEASTQFIVDHPGYAGVMAKTFFQLHEEHRLARLLVGDTRRQAEEAFTCSQQAGEIDSETDTTTLAELFTAHQWGLILAWSKGLIPLDQFSTVTLRSQITTLLPVSRGALKDWLQARAKAKNIPYINQ